MISIFGAAHTRLSSSSDKLIYRNGKIEAHLELSPDSQEAFEKRLEGLKLKLGTDLKTAQEEYQKNLRALFVEFGQILAEPPIDLTYVEAKTAMRAAE